MLSAMQFTRVFLDKMKLGLAKSSFEVIAPLQIRVNNVNDDELMLDLWNAYFLYVSRQEDIDTLIEDRIELVKNGKILFENNKVNSIFPVLRPKSYLKEIEKLWEQSGCNGNGASLYMQQLTDSVCILYVFDEASSMRYVSSDDVRELDLTDKEVRAIALNNLDSYFQSIQVSVTKLDTQSNGDLYTLNADENYESSALLSDSIWAGDYFPVKGQYTAFIPARNILIVVGSKDKVGYEAASSIAKRWYGELIYTVSTAAFMRVNGVWHELP